MKKLLLSLAMVATMGISVGAAAAVDLETSTSNPAVFASELAVPAAGTTLNASAVGSSALDVSVELGFGFDTQDSMGLRLALSGGASFSPDNPPTVTFAGCTDGDVGATDSIDGNTPSGFSSDNSAAVWSLTNTCGSPLEIDTALSFVVPEVNIADQSSVTVTYSAHDNGFAANDNTSPAGVETGALIVFAPVLSFDAEASTNTKEIDVTEDSLLFATAPTNESEFGTATLSLLNTATLALDLSTISVIDDIVDLASSTLTVSGNFSSATELGCGGDADIDAATVLNSEGNAEFAGDDVASGTSAASDTVSYTCVFETDTTTAIQETTFELSAALTGATNFSSQSFGPFTMSEFDKNGSTTELDLLYNSPMSTSFIRITNPSTIDGDVFFTLINDEGTRVTFPMSAITGQPSGVNAGESSGLIPTSSLVVAARTVDSIGAVTFKRNKYRVIIDAEFGGSGNDDVRAQIVHELGDQIDVE